MNDWEVNPDAYLRDAESGELLLKADGTPKKKPGRPKGSKGRAYNYHSETKAKLAARRTVRNKEKKLAQVRTQLRKKERVANDVIQEENNDARREYLNEDKGTGNIYHVCSVWCIPPPPLS